MTNDLLTKQHEFMTKDMNHMLNTVLIKMVDTFNLTITDILYQLTIDKTPEKHIYFLNNRQAITLIRKRMFDSYDRIEIIENYKFWDEMKDKHNKSQGS